MSEMRAWRVREFCEPEDMAFETVARPEPGPGQALVKGDRLRELLHKGRGGDRESAGPRLRSGAGRVFFCLVCWHGLKW